MFKGFVTKIQLSYALEFHMLSLKTFKTKKKKNVLLDNSIHLGPESSMAWTNNKESSVRSEYLSDEEDS